MQPNLSKVSLNTTNSHRAPSTVRSDTERDPIGRRTESDRTADGTPVLLHILHRQAFILYVVFLESSCSMEEVLGFFFHYTDNHILSLPFNLIEKTACSISSTAIMSISFSPLLSHHEAILVYCSLSIIFALKYLSSTFPVYVV